MNKDDYDTKGYNGGVTAPLVFALAGFMMVAGSCIRSRSAPGIDDSCAGEQPQNMALCKRIYLGHYGDGHKSHD